MKDFTSIVLGGAKETPEQQAANRARKIARKEADRKRAQNAPFDRLIQAIVDSAQAEFYKEKIKAAEAIRRERPDMTLNNLVMGLREAVETARDVEPWIPAAMMVADRWESIPASRRDPSRLKAGLRRLQRETSNARVSAVIKVLAERGHDPECLVSGWVRFRHII